MAKAQLQNFTKKDRQKIIGDFFEIITELKTKNETVGFLMGLLTPSEAFMLARRIQIAKLLLEGKNYYDIHIMMQVSEGTIASVAKWLYGDNDQFYKQISKHIKKDNKKRNKKYYGNLLNPYRQLKIIEDIFNR